MLFIPIDVLMMKPKSHLTSGLNHVAWFILHCLVFREQSLVLSNRAAHLSDLFIVSHRFLSVKNFFEFLFKNFLAKSASNISQPLATQGLLVVFRCRISQRLVLWYTSFPHMSTPFSKKVKNGVADGSLPVFTLTHLFPTRHNQGAGFTMILTGRFDAPGGE